MYNRSARSQSVNPVKKTNLIASNANSQERERLQHDYNRLTQVAPLHLKLLFLSCKHGLAAVKVLLKISNMTPVQEAQRMV